MNEHTLQVLIQWSLVVLSTLLCIVILIFFLLILIKEHTLKKQTMQRQHWREAVLHHLHNGVPLPPIPKSDEAIVLALILEQAEYDNADYSQSLLALGLDQQLIADLHNNSNKILAIKNIGISKIPQSFALLQPYWNAKDFDESYFSLYYTLELPHTSLENQDILQAILAAVFNGERKVEMIRRLALPNAMLLQHIHQPTCSHDDCAVLIASLRADTLSDQEILTLAHLAKDDIGLQKALILLLTRSDQPAAARILEHYIGPQQPVELRIEAAYRLGERQTEAAFALLKRMLYDENWEVRTHSAINLLHYGDRGRCYLESVCQDVNASAASDMAHLQLSIHPPSTTNAAQTPHKEDAP